MLSETCCDDLYSANFLMQGNLIVNVYHINGKKIVSDSVKLAIKDTEGTNLGIIKDSLISYYITNAEEKYEVKINTKKDSLTYNFNTSNKGEIKSYTGYDTSLTTIYRKKTEKFQVFNIYPKRKNVIPDTLLLSQRSEKQIVSDSIALPSEFKIVSDKGQTKDTSNIKKSDIESVTYSFHFAYNEKDFIRSQKHNFDYIVKMLKEHPKNIVVVEAHTDNIAGDTYNIWLSQTRAERIKAYLVSHGINQNRIKALGFGETKPIADNFHADGTDDPFGRAQNRRGVIRITKGE